MEDSKNADIVGKRVAVFPILPCGKCAMCAKEEYAGCVSYNYYGSRCDGGMQDYLLVKEDNLVFLPEGVSFEAGAMTEPMAVCLHAVKKASIDENTRVLIYGAGTIGMLCAMWAKHLGAVKVTVSDIDPNKLAMAARLGFPAVEKEETADVVIDASGACAALCDGIERLTPMGRMVLVGNTERDVTLPQGVYSKLLRKQLTLIGSWNSDYKTSSNDWTDSVRAVAEGVIDPTVLITHRLALTETERLLSLIDDRTEFYQKIMLEME